MNMDSIHVAVYLSWTARDAYLCKFKTSSAEYCIHLMCFTADTWWSNYVTEIVIKSVYLYEHELHTCSSVSVLNSQECISLRVQSSFDVHPLSRHTHTHILFFINFDLVEQILPYMSMNVTSIQ